MGFVGTQVAEVVQYCSCSTAYLASVVSGEGGGQTSKRNPSNSFFRQLIRMLGRALSLLLLGVGGTLLGGAQVGEVLGVVVAKVAEDRWEGEGDEGFGG